LPAIDHDIAALEKKLELAASKPELAANKAASKSRIQECIREVLGRPHRVRIDADHAPPPPFRAGEPLEIRLTLQKPPKALRLYYRHVNQAERFQSILMQPAGNLFAAAIPAAYTDSPYTLQYYFEIQQDPRNASLYPGFGPDLTNQPYFVVRQS